MYKTLIECYRGYGLMDKSPEELEHIIDTNGEKDSPVSTEDGLVMNSVILACSRMSDQNSMFRDTEHMIALLKDNVRHLQDLQNENRRKTDETHTKRIAAQQVVRCLSDIYADTSAPAFIRETLEDMGRQYKAFDDAMSNLVHESVELSRQSCMLSDAVNVRGQVLDIQNKLVEVVNTPADRRVKLLRELKRALAAFNVKKVGTADLTASDAKKCVYEDGKVTEVELMEDPAFKESALAIRNARNNDVECIEAILKMVKAMVK